jgi:TolA-binding protein
MKLTEMKQTRAVALPILIMALTPGCAWWQALVGKPAMPAQSQTATASTAQPPALEAKLDEVNGRLARMEQTLVAVRVQGQQRQKQEVQTQQLMGGLRREVRDTRMAVVGVQRQMKQNPAPDGAATASADFWAVDAPLGELPNGGGKRETRRIPALVPDRAREILVYVQIATGYAKGGPHRFRLSVRTQGDREAAFYLYAVGQPQPSWAYNSDNVWLPMPKNRELILQAEGEPFFGDWNSEVRIVGYR